MSEDEQNHQYCWNPNANTFGNSFLNLSARAVNSIGSFFTVETQEFVTKKRLDTKHELCAETTNCKISCMMIVIRRNLSQTEDLEV